MAPSKCNWSEADELPLLLRTTIRPVKDAAEFSTEHGDFNYPRKPRLSCGATEKPFEKDDEAVVAARAWITEHFGQSPAIYITEGRTYRS